MVDPRHVVVEIMFLTLFVAEMILKMVGLGRKTYFESKFNWYVKAVLLLGTCRVALTTSHADIGLIVS